MNHESLYKEKNYPRAIIKCNKTIAADAFVNNHANMTIKQGGYIVFDMGAGSVGGYPLFSVVGYTGKPTVRISYSDRLTTYSDESTMDKGDFARGSCIYLGIELPVMPANPYRFEDYHINRTGLFLYPLIQGQQRFVMISVRGDTETDCSVTFNDFYILDDADKSLPVGYFKCDDERLDRIWTASARTLRLATVKANQFEIIENKLCLRKLTKYRSEALVCRKYNSSDEAFKYDTNLIAKKNIQINCEFELSVNPEYESGISFLFFANRSSKQAGLIAYKLDIMQSGYLKINLIHENETFMLAEAHVQAFIDNYPYKLFIDGHNHVITVRINDKTVLDYVGQIYCSGYFGISMEQEWRAIIDSLTVTSQDKIIYSLSDGLMPFDICRTDYFISDGAKRDRIPWSGDLDWAFDSGWYAFGKAMKAKNTLDILGRHANPEGYIFATCYPENDIIPKEDEYGYYQSDMFAAWYVISVLTYGRLAGNEKISSYYNKLRSCLEYLWQYVDREDGLFYQRYETSKGLWDHKLGDVGKNTYTNLIIYDAMKTFAEYTYQIGAAVDACVFEQRAQIMREGIFTYLYDEKQGGFIKRKDLIELCDLANPYAMCKGLVSDKIAKDIALQAEQITHGYGKIILLMIHGLYRYGYTEQARKMLYGRTPLYASDRSICCYVDWMSVVNSCEYPETVYECMHNPPLDFGENNNWGDLCHPDSGVCGIISGRIAGILPAEDGFKSILLQPSPGELKQIECRVPVSGGYADIHICVSDSGSSIEFSLPKNIPVQTDFSRMIHPVQYIEKRI